MREKIICYLCGITKLYHMAGGRTYKKVVTKKSGKTKTKNISAKKYQRKLKKAIKKGKPISQKTKVSLGPFSSTSKRTQTISKTKKSGRTKSFVGTSTSKATPAQKAAALRKARIAKDKASIVEKELRKAALKKKRSTQKAINPRKKLQPTRGRSVAAKAMGRKK